jgi:hypothetical protein
MNNRRNAGDRGRSPTVPLRLYVRRDLIEQLMSVAPDPRYSLSTMTNAAIEAALLIPETIEKQAPLVIAKNAQDVSATWQTTRS